MSNKANEAQLGMLGRLNQSETAEHVVSPLGIIGGYILASLAGAGLDKISAIAPDPAATGFQWKSLIKPAVLGTIGIGMVWGGTRHKDEDNRDKPHNMKLLLKNGGYGFLLATVVSTGKSVLKKDVSFGLGNVGSSNVPGTTYYVEKKAEIDRILNENSWRPQPFASSQSSEDSSQEGGVNGPWGSSLEYGANIL